MMLSHSSQLPSQPRKRAPPFALQIVTTSPSPPAFQQSRPSPLSSPYVTPDADPCPSSPAVLQSPFALSMPFPDPSPPTASRPPSLIASSSSSSPSTAMTGSPCTLLPAPAPKRAMRNTKNLQLAIGTDVSPSVHPFSPVSHIAPHLKQRPKPKPSLPALNLCPSRAQPEPQPESSSSRAPRRRHSAVTLLSCRASEYGPTEQPPEHPYHDGPIEILPRVWLGSEENARDPASLRERGIRCVLNVAKEVDLELDEDLEMVPEDAEEIASPTAADSMDVDGDEAAACANARLKYLKLPWSHGQSDLVKCGFLAGMAFIDRALARDEGVLVHCQCGVSRSATLAIALVMRAAHHKRSTSCMSDEDVALAAISGMHDAYAFVKGKSPWVGPNMSLIYQLLEYERELAALHPPSNDVPASFQPPPALEAPSSRTRSSSQSSSISSGAEDWNARRLAFSSGACTPSLGSPASSSPGPASPPTPEVYASILSPSEGPESLEARALDQQMEVRRAALRPQPLHVVTAASPRERDWDRQWEKPRLGLAVPPRASRMRAASAESALSAIVGRDMCMLVEVDEEEGVGA